MDSVLLFLKPSWLKLIFLVELPVFVIIELFSRGAQTLEGLPVFLLPLVFYYLVGSTLIYLHEKGHKLANLWSCLRVALILLVLDQGLKVTILNTLPAQK